jgi:GTP-binding protein HflX
MSQLRVTEEVLTELGAGAVPRLLVLNKIDRVPDEAAMRAELATRFPDGIVISAKRPADVALLRLAFIGFFATAMVEEVIVLPYDRQQLRGELFENCEVLGETYDEAGAHLRVRAAPETIARLRARLA